MYTSHLVCMCICLHVTLCVCMTAFAKAPSSRSVRSICISCLLVFCTWAAEAVLRLPTNSKSTTVILSPYCLRRLKGSKESVPWLDAALREICRRPSVLWTRSRCVPIFFINQGGVRHLRNPCPVCCWAYPLQVGHWQPDMLPGPPKAFLREVREQCPWLLFVRLGSCVEPPFSEVQLVMCMAGVVHS